MIYPFIVAIFSVLSLVSTNMDRVVVEGFLAPLILLLGSCFLTLVVYSISYLILRDKQKSSLVTLIVIVPVLYFYHFITLINSLKLPIPIGLLVTFPGLAFLGFIYYILNSPTRLKLIHKLLSTILPFILIIPLILILAYFIKSNPERVTSENLVLVRPEEPKDIYYIVLDGYGSNKSLKEFYNYDNSDFTDWLVSKGFKINLEATSNYTTTYNSLSSSLYLDYINEISLSWVGLASPTLLVQDSRVSKALKAIGYKYITFDSGWDPTQGNRFSDINFKSYTLGGLATTYLSNTCFYPISRELLTVEQKDRLIGSFSRLKDLDKLKEPKFIFCHLVTPHPPYIFNSKGDIDATAAPNSGSWGEKEKYIDQLIYLNKRLKEIVTDLLEDNSNCIIVLQADHGTATTYKDAGIKLPTDTMVRERFGILNAIYSKDNSLEVVPPINTFREIFNTYYGTNLEILPDLKYYQWYYSFLSYLDVTDRLK